MSRRHVIFMTAAGKDWARCSEGDADFPKGLIDEDSDLFDRLPVTDVSLNNWATSWARAIDRKNGGGKYRIEVW